MQKASGYRESVYPRQCSRWQGYCNRRGWEGPLVDRVRGPAEEGGALEFRREIPE